MVKLKKAKTLSPLKKIHKFKASRLGQEIPEDGFFKGFMACGMMLILNGADGWISAGSLMDREHHFKSSTSRGKKRGTV